MRFDLLYGVSFDEKSDDPINRAITQNAVALVEDFKSRLAYVYRQKRDSNALGNADEAERGASAVLAGAQL